MSVRVAVPTGSHRIEVRYAGGDPVVYLVGEDGVVEVAEQNLSEFLSAIHGSYVYVPPPAPESGAKPVPKEK